MTDKPRTRRLALTLISGQPRLCDEQTGELIEGVVDLTVDIATPVLTRVEARLNILHDATPRQ